jgi:hypothetical protein
MGDAGAYSPARSLMPSQNLSAQVPFWRKPFSSSFRLHARRSSASTSSSRHRSIYVLCKTSGVHLRDLVSRSERAVVSFLGG